MFQRRLKQVKEGEGHEFILPRYPDKDQKKTVRSWSHEARNRDLEAIGVYGIRAVGTCRRV